MQRDKRDARSYYYSKVFYEFLMTLDDFNQDSGKDLRFVRKIGASHLSMLIRPIDPPKNRFVELIRNLSNRVNEGDFSVDIYDYRYTDEEDIQQAITTEFRVNHKSTTARLLSDTSLISTYEKHNFSRLNVRKDQEHILNRLKHAVGGYCHI